MATDKQLLHQRIWAALRSRDWFGVGLEVFAVVLGVLLGLQASQWADERATDRARDALENRLATDLVTYAEGVRYTAAQRDERLNAIARLDTMLRAGTVRTADRAEVLDAIGAVFSFDDIRPLPLSFAEMIGGGSLERLDDEQTRSQLESISRLHARFVETGRLLNNGTFDLYLELQPELLDQSASARRLMIEKGPEGPDAGYPLDTPINWDLLESERFRHALDLANQRDTFLHIYGVEMANRADDTAQVLAERD